MNVAVDAGDQGGRTARYGFQTWMFLRSDIDLLPSFNASGEVFVR